MPKPATKPQTQPLSMWYLTDGVHYRVGRSDWFNDQFCVLKKHEFAQVMRVCKWFSIRLEPVVDD